jgi:thiamine kinase-like enzyme
VATAPIEDVLPRVSMWAGRVLDPRRLPGGLSHQIWRVDCAGESYVLRMLDEAVSTVGLGIPADQEVANTRLAAESGVGARVFEVVDDPAAVVLEYLPGRTLSAAEVRQPPTIDRIALACRRLHSGPRFVNDFDIFATLTQLLDECRLHDLVLPDGYLDRLTTVRAVHNALTVVPQPALPCHNDLLAENFIDVDGVIRIVDYQLSGNNDPAFELGDIAAESDFDPDLVGRLATAYYRDALSRELLARVRLYLLMSNVTWTLWFAIHHGLLSNAAAGFDYTAEAADKWAQACRDLDSAELGTLLHLVTGRSAPAASTSTGTTPTTTPTPTPIHKELS